MRKIRILLWASVAVFPPGFLFCTVFCYYIGHTDDIGIWTRFEDWFYFLLATIIFGGPVEVLLFVAALVMTYRQPRVPADEKLDGTEQAVEGHPPRLIAEILRFLLGAVSALCLPLLAFCTEIYFLPPLVGSMDASRIHYAYSARPVHYVFGFGIIVSGWLLGGLLLRMRRKRDGFALGVLIASTLLGLVWALGPHREGWQ